MNKVNENKNKPKRKPITTRQQNNMNKKRAISLIRDCDLSGAAGALVSEGMAPIDDHIKQQMIDKHPAQNKPNVNEFNNEYESVQVDILSVWEILKRLKYNSGAGPSGLRPRHIKSCAKSNIG